MALDVARAFEVELDFTTGSVAVVETILSQLHDEYRRTRNADGFEGLGLEMAAYIVTVIERNICVGKWQRNSREFGKDSFPYYLPSGRIIFPYAWCLKRLLDGEGDDVCIKFKTLVDQAQAF